MADGQCNIKPLLQAAALMSLEEFLITVLSFVRVSFFQLGCLSRDVQKELPLYICLWGEVHRRPHLLIHLFSL